MKEDRLAFVLIEGSYDQFLKTDNQVTQFLRKDDVENIIHFSVLPAAWRGGGWIAIAMMYQERIPDEPRKDESDQNRVRRTTDPAKKRDKPKPLK